MPELPEVETTKRGIQHFTVKNTLKKMIVRNRQLRWPIEEGLEKKLARQKINDLNRRGKYLLFYFDSGTLLWHLGMSGSLRIVDKNQANKKHDHVDLEFVDGTVLRFNDPRRFGAVVWTEAPVEEHSLLNHLGPEPLTEQFNADYLFQKSRKKKQAVKSWIMDSKLVVGVGNIYANESLFNSGIHPLKAAGKLSKKNYEVLVDEIKHVLGNAIKQGGTTLRDFVGGDGKPGYFAQQLNVYGRGGEACNTCGKTLTEKQVAKRQTVYCTHCQK